MSRSLSQNGNVLFLILIAVALFAALSYAVTSSTRSGGGDAAKETVQTSAARIINYYTTLQAGLQRLMVINSAKITDLRFDNNLMQSVGGPLTMGALGNPANPGLYVFHPQGGGVIPQTFEDLAAPCPACSSGNTKPGHMYLIWANLPNTGSATADAVAGTTGLSLEICRELNLKYGVSGTLPVLNVANANIIGTTASPALSAASGTNIAAIANKTGFCYQEGTSPSRYIYAHIMQIN